MQKGTDIQKDAANPPNKLLAIFFHHKDEKDKLKFKYLRQHAIVLRIICTS